MSNVSAYNTQFIHKMSFLIASNGILGSAQIPTQKKTLFYREKIAI